ncbi:glycosyl hydrolase family 28 protein [Sporolactobacillus shoreicorticis]|uniref:Glycosyl hydrolase family 28 protein n=1 Tax=Sporolactobacillus shoreicorticis TaxID=1923877 RepID=A0ABW5S1V4_9BACL|nr:glycosyl hydrolase family 28 protein [Sporolactobacillus shoreicorticis]MCO7124691.1 glycosyl hydrolase family 28 protein [Sporolactobacillus shoreicorticis]
MTDKMNFSIIDFGAESNSSVVQTAAFQRCIDVCRDASGGTVIVPAGQYTIGSIRLYSNIRLLLRTGAVLNGSTDLKDYQTFDEEPDIRYLHDEYFVKAWHLPPYYFQALITAYDATNVTVEAEPGAIIDGHDVFDVNGEEKFRGPMGLVFARVTNLQLHGYTIQNSSNWSHVIAGCEHVSISSVSIIAGHDGFNLHHSTHITVKDCILKTGDDCFAGYDVVDLTVTDSWLNTACNSMRIGGTNLQFSHCIFVGPGRNPHRSENTYYSHACFKYYAIDADEVRDEGHDIVISDSLITGICHLMMYRCGDKVIMQNGRPLRELTFKGNLIDHIDATSELIGNGEQVRLNLHDCRITPPENGPLLVIDKSVELSIKNVTFTRPTVIAQQNGEPLHFDGYTVSAYISSNEQGE